MSQIRVLVPLDGSSFAERALDMLPVLAGLGDLYVRLIGAVDTAELESLRQAEEWIEKEERLLREHLQLKKQEIEATAALAGWDLQRGRPAAVILTAAERFDPDYLIISSHGRSGVQRWRLGSVADKLVRGAACNVLVVGPKTISKRTAIRNLMVALDGSKAAEAALPYAVAISNSMEARLHIVRAATHPAFADEAGWAWKAVQDSTRAYLDSILARLEDANAVTAMPLGQPAPELDKYAREHHIDLTVMTTHGRGGFLRTALGSVTDALIGGRTPVLVVKKPLS